MTDEVIILKDVEIMWCNHNALGKMSGKYEVTFTNLSDEHVALLESLNLQVRTRKDKPEQGRFMTVKSIHPLPIVNSDYSPLSDVAVGNGTRGNAKLSSYKPKMKPINGADYLPTLIKMRVTDLIEYKPSDASANEGLGDDDDDLL